MSQKPFGIAVRAIVRDKDGNCLLLRRSSKNRGHVGRWEWPGGKLDAGESLDAAVCREVREETGLEVVLTGFAGAFHVEMARQYLVVLCMEAELSKGTLRLSVEHDDYQWVRLRNVPQWKLTDGLDSFAEAYVARDSSGAP
jgi:8-oxo-dGTP diphosphatase